MADGTPPNPALDDAQAVNSDTSPGAAAQADATVATCPDVALNYGVFFDGTYNNATNVDSFRNGTTSETGGSYDNYHTNVYRLSRTYFGRANNVPAACGTVDEAFGMTYIDGIGSSAGQPDDLLAAGTGYGDFGVNQALQKAVNNLRAFILQYGGNDAVRSIKLDVFGFSRGAATARIFANLIAGGEVPNAEVRFLGLYDTVGSFGIPGNSLEMSPQDEALYYACYVPYVRLRLLRQCMAVPTSDTVDMDVHANTAQHVYHMVADDEFRAFFPSSSVTPGHGTEVVMPGNHGDVGGSTPPAQFFEETMNPPRFLRDRGYWDTAYRVDIPPSNNVDRLLRNWDYNYRRLIEPGIWMVGYTAMLARAQQAGAPMHNNPVALPPDLQGLTATLIAGGRLGEAQLRPIRTKYVRMSHGSLGPDMLDINQVRESYPNRP